MNLRMALLLLTALALAGCGGPDRHLHPGEVTFQWSFAGLSCGEVPHVRAVKIRLPGEALQNDGIYPCSVSGFQGIVLHDFAGGSYPYALEALGYGDEVLYRASGTLEVNGSVRVAVDLTPAGAYSSYAYLTWRFPPSATSANPTCADLGVSTVELSLDEGITARYPCAAGERLPGAMTPFVPPGSHALSLWALDADGYELFHFQGALQTFGGAPVAAEYRLGWSVGGAPVRWQLTDGSLAQSCAQAGIDTVWVNFQDAQGSLLYGPSGDAQPCSGAPIYYDYLPPGTHRVFLQGTGPGGRVYLSSASAPPSVTVVAGEFARPTDAVLVQLFRRY
jgi:hypothetical protein